MPISNQRKSILQRRYERSRKQKPISPLTPPNILIRQYEKAILAENKRFQNLVKNVILGNKEYRSIFDSRMDGKIDMFQKLMRRLYSIFYKEQVEIETVADQKNYLKRIVKDIVTPNILKVEKKQKDDFGKEYSSILGVDPLKNEPFLQEQVDAATEENVSLISSIQSSGFDDVKRIITGGIRAGSSDQDIANQLQVSFELSDSRAKLIARDQVRKFYAALNRERAKNNGLTKYTWRITNVRTRPDHEKLEGQSFLWDSPPVTVASGKRAGEKNHPGEDIQCNCYAENDYSIFGVE